MPQADFANQMRAMKERMQKRTDRATNLPSLRSSPRIAPRIMEEEHELMPPTVSEEVHTRMAQPVARRPRGQPRLIASDPSHIGSRNDMNYNVQPVSTFGQSQEHVLRTQVRQNLPLPSTVVNRIVQEEMQTLVRQYTHDVHEQVVGDRGVRSTQPLPPVDEAKRAADVGKVQAVLAEAGIHESVAPVYALSLVQHGWDDAAQLQGLAVDKVEQVCKSLSFLEGDVEKVTAFVRRQRQSITFEASTTTTLPVPQRKSTTSRAGSGTQLTGSQQSEEREEEETGDDCYPTVVISYQSEQMAFLDDVRKVFEGWGFFPWDGRDVKAGGDWKWQWMERVMSDNTVLIVILISESFMNSDACDSEFNIIMDTQKLKCKTVPIVVNERTKQMILSHDSMKSQIAELFQHRHKVVLNRCRGYKMSLVNCNFIHPLEDLDSMMTKVKISAKVKLDDNGDAWPENVEKENEEMTITEMDNAFEERWESIKEQLADAFPDKEPFFIGAIGSVNFDFSVSRHKDQDTGLGIRDRGERSKKVLKAVGEHLANLQIPSEPKGSSSSTGAGGRRGSTSGASRYTVLVTGGFTGVGEVLAKAFYAEVKKNHGEEIANWRLIQALPEGYHKKMDPMVFTNAGSKAPLAIGISDVHNTVWRPGEPTIWNSKAPMKSHDDLDFTPAFETKMEKEYGPDWPSKAKFGAWSEGWTIFIGGTNEERQRFLGNTLPVIVMAEGGGGASNEAKIAQAKGRIVVPIGCLGGAAQDIGRADHPEPAKPNKAVEWLKQTKMHKEYEILQDWDKSEQPKVIAEALTKIVTAVADVDKDVKKWTNLDPAKFAENIGEWRARTPKSVQLLNYDKDSKWRVSDIKKKVSRKALDSTLSQEAECLRQMNHPSLDERDIDNLKEFIKEKGGNAVLIDGHGTKNQYFGKLHMDEKGVIRRVNSPTRAQMVALLTPVVRHIDEHMNKSSSKESKLDAIKGVGRNWVAIYGGDPASYDPDKEPGPNNPCDAGWMVKVLHEEFNVPIIATQCDMYASYMFPKTKAEPMPKEYSHLEGGGILAYGTTQKRDMSGRLEPEFGGFNKESQLVGASKIWWDLRLREMIRYHVVVGGGPVAMYNASMALFGNEEERAWADAALKTDPTLKASRVPVLYVPSRALHCPVGITPGAWQGQVHDFLMQRKLRKLITKATYEQSLVCASDPDPGKRSTGFVLEYVAKS